MVLYPTTGWESMQEMLASEQARCDVMWRIIGWVGATKRGRKGRRVLGIQSSSEVHGTTVTDNYKRGGSAAAAGSSRYGLTRRPNIAA